MGKAWQWLAVHLEIRDSHKIRQLYRLLNCSRAEAIGLLILVWMWATSNITRDGELLSATYQDIEEAAFWRGKSGVLFSALVEATWIDELDGKLFIHDWPEHNKPYYDYSDRLEYDRKRKSEKHKDIPEEIPSEKCSEIPKEQSPENPVLQYSTNNTIQDNKVKYKYTADFESFFSIYPRKGEKTAAFKCWSARIKDGYLSDDLKRAAGSYAIERKGQDPSFTKLAKTFLGSGLPFLDHLNPSIELTPGQDDLPPEATSPWAIMTERMQDNEVIENE